jgi:hypothetical protein
MTTDIGILAYIFAKMFYTNILSIGRGTAVYSLVQMFGHFQSLVVFVRLWD